MTQTIHQLMLGNLLEVFDERDPVRRRTAIERIYAPDVRWTDDEGVNVGHDALDAKAAALQGGLGPLRFVPDGAVHQTTGFGYLAWHLVADGDPTPRCRASTWRSSATTSSPSCTPSDDAADGLTPSGGVQRPSARRPSAISGPTALSTSPVSAATPPPSLARNAMPAAMIATLKYPSAM